MKTYALFFGHPVYIYYFSNQVAICVVVYPLPLVHLDMFIQHFNMAIILSVWLNKQEQKYIYMVSISDFKKGEGDLWGGWGGRGPAVAT